MLARTQQPCLTQKSGPYLVLAHKFVQEFMGLQKLQGHDPAQSLMPDLVDSAHAAPAKASQYIVAPYLHAHQSLVA